VTRREDDPADGFDLPDDAGNSRGGQEAVLTDYQTANLILNRNNVSCTSIQAVTYCYNVFQEAVTQNIDGGGKTTLTFKQMYKSPWVPLDLKATRAQSTASFYR